MGFLHAKKDNVSESFNDSVFNQKRFFLVEFIMSSREALQRGLFLTRCELYETNTKLSFCKIEHVNWFIEKKGKCLKLFCVTKKRQIVSIFPQINCGLQKNQLKFNYSRLGNVDKKCRNTLVSNIFRNSMLWDSVGKLLSLYGKIDVDWSNWIHILKLK